MTDDIPAKADCIKAIIATQGKRADVDRRAMMESPGEVVRGLRYAMKAMGASRGIVLVPANRTDLYRRLAREIDGVADIRVMRDADETADCPRLNASVLMEIARSVERALATGEGEAGVETAKASPIGRHYRWLIEQSGGTIHAPYRVMVDGRKQ